MEQAEILLRQGDHDAVREFLEMAQKYATSRQLKEIEDLNRRYNIRSN
jgi:hypothetical protein|tara:strand:- start:19228 stop:19371 length:144 start_codon:yes stop_codon:yes gene_type:complete